MRQGNFYFSLVAFVLERLISQPWLYAKRELDMLSIYRLLFIFGLVLMGGCAQLAGPKYESPSAPQKDLWKSSKSSDVSARDAINLDWWRGFGDKDLDKLVEKALRQNIDLKILTAQIGVAEAVIGEVKVAMLPSIHGGGGNSYQQRSGRNATHQYAAATSLNWEIDIWGKVKKGVQAQQAAISASAADYRAGYLTLVGHVATNYFQILQFDEQIKQQNRSLNDAKRILHIFEGMLTEGMVAQSQVLQQNAEIHRLQRELLELQRHRDITENAIATLLGIPAGGLHLKKGTLSQNIKLMDVPEGIPSDLLSRRPDIVAAEYRVLQAHNISGEARLARLPSFGLSGRFGSASSHLSDLLKSFTGLLQPSLDIPILDPSVHARIRISDAEAKVAREEYRRVVMNAYEEVESALIDLDSHKKQHAELKKQLSKLRTVSRQVNQKLKEGLLSQLEVFESERSLLVAEQSLLENKQRILSDTVVLYKALGGGWPKKSVGNDDTSG
jgi:NodT family efflux transporter outer membrane factor (OMF) lipoprotein